MESFVFSAAVDGDTSVLNEGIIAERGENSYVAKTPDLENNIIHLAVQNKKSTFIDAAINRFPVLLQQKNSKGNTPFHEAAELGNKETIILLVRHLQETTSDVPYYMEKNNQGDTPFHAALRARNLDAAYELFIMVVQYHREEILATQNNSKETPLHLYVRFCAGEFLSMNLEHADKRELIEKLITTYPPAMLIKDSDGLTPHMRAAQYGRVLVALRILTYNKQLSECRDIKGRSFLHNLRLKMAHLNASDKEYTLWTCNSILSLHGIHALLFSQDQDGNTPLHLAIADRDFNVAQLFLQQCAKNESSARKKLIMSLQNSDGKTILDLIDSLSDIPPKLMTLIAQSAKDRIMDNDLYNAALYGDTRLFERRRQESKEADEIQSAARDDNTNEYDDYYFLSQANDGSSIIHIALRHDHKEFIMEGVKHFSHLIYHKDSKGDTPLHVAARLQTLTALEFLESSITTWYVANYRSSEPDHLPPWIMKNSKGNTFLHEAASTSNYQVLLLAANNKFVSSEAFSDVNNNGETILHVIARYANFQDSQTKDVMLTLLNIIKADVLHMRDVDGLTPTLRAAQCGKLELLGLVSCYFPSLMLDCDHKGRTILHLLRTSTITLDNNSGSTTLWAYFTGLQAFGSLIFIQDHDGNTPLHLSIILRDFEIVDNLFKCYAKINSNTRKEFVNIKNNDGKSIIDLIVRESDIPSYLLTLIAQPAKGRLMDNDLYNAALYGDTRLFERRRHESKGASEIQSIDHSNNSYEYDDDYFLSQANDGSNIIHIALQLDHKEFIVEGLKHFWDLIYHKDSKGDTPLHVAARLQTATALEFLKTSMTTWCESNRSFKTDHFSPWKMKNSKGNTFLHEAASTSNYEALYFATKIDYVSSEALSDMNDNGETVLHVIARYANFEGSLSKNVMLRLLNISKIDVLHMRDVDGLTPTLRAAQCGKLELLSLISHYFPSLIQNCNHKGRTILHLLRTSTITTNNNLEGSTTSWTYFTVLHGLGSLIFSQDHDGNTPLHLAIIVRDFEIAHDLFKWYAQITSISWKEYVNIKNNDGKSVVDLIVHGSNIPLYLKKLIELASIIGRKMDDKLHAAARTGDTHLFQQRSSQENDEISHETVQDHKENDEMDTYDDTYFCRQAEDGSNIIHIALRHGHEQFVKEALERFFDLIFQKDSIGDTPLHVAARLQTPAALRFLQSSLHNGRNRDSVQNSEIENLRILAVSNSKGNTILHEAARTNNYETIRHLLSWSRYTGNIEGISCTNHKNENFLHLLARYATYAATSSSYSTKYSLMARELYISASCAYVRDKDGFTPVLRAVQCRRLRLANFLVNKFPESIKIFDHKYRTVLHHLSAALVIDVVDDSEDITPLLKKFIEFHGVCDFRLAQDEDGNTPLHLAIMNEDVSTTKFLMELCLREEERPELTMINKDGHSIFNLLSSKGHIATLFEMEKWVSKIYIEEKHIEEKMMLKAELYQATEDEDIDMAEKLNYALTYMEERQRVDKMMMDSELYQAAIDSDVQIFRKVSTNRSQYFTRTSLDGSSIIHIAVRHAKPETIMFLQHALRLFPHLISKPDSNGDTLVHLAAKCKTDFSADIISMYYGSVKEMKGVATNPSAVKNYKGSLAIHEALQADNLKAAKILLERSEFVATTRINDLEETPLHAYARYDSSRNGDAKGFLSTLFKKDKSAAYIRDNQGFTPLLRAAMSARFHVVKAILDDCPQSANLRDPNGRTFLHLVRFTGGEVDESLTDKFEQTGKQLFKYPEVDLQRLVQDNDGNTPLHYAIKTGNSIVAIVLTQRCLESRTRAELDLVNKEGATVSDLLAAHDVPNEVIELIRKKEPEAVYSARSSYGIHKTDMKYSANALSVVAGLLTTITFAAGIQVPGGFNEDDGSSVLLLKPAFQAFIVFNTFAMCGSMLVLFYLLWVMGIGKIHGSLMVLDLSIFVLRACFYSTLGAFTTGVYVTTSEKSFWLAIFVCVICFLTIFVTIKVSVANITRLGKWVSKSSRMMLSLIRGRYNAHMTAIPFQPVANKDKVDVIVESKAP